MRKKQLLVLLLLLLVSTIEAQHYHYVPNALNIPNLSKKNDLEVMLGWSRGLNFQALELQGTYSIHRHIALVANYFGARNKRVQRETEVGTDYFFWEAGVGAFEPLPKGAASLFAGYGNGDLLNNYGPLLNAKLKLQRWFIQPGLNYQSEHFRAALALRLSRLNYRRGVVAFSIEPGDLQYIQNIEAEAPLFLPEIGLQAGLVVRFITVNFGVVAIFPGTDRYNFARVGTTMSLVADFGAMKKGKATKKED